MWCAQNKNFILVSEESFWLLNVPQNIKEVQMILPMTGHSFIPTGRVFGNIETEVRKHEIIYDQNQYSTII